jgi:hypothetical protein
MKVEFQNGNSSFTEKDQKIQVKRNIKNNPATLGEKKVKLPPTSFQQPGLILPKQC